MKRKPNPKYSIAKLLLSIASCCIFLHGCGGTSSLQQYQTNTPESIEENTRIKDFSFNGYSTHWQDLYNKQVRYSNLIRFDVQDITKTILQSKINIAEDIGLPGLQMQEGFLNGLLNPSFKTLEDPSLTELEESLAEDHVLAYVNPSTETGQYLNELFGDEIIPYSIPAHQYGAPDLALVKAYLVKNGDRKLWVITTSDEQARNNIKSLIRNVREIVDEFDFHKGWFGVQTLLKSVTATPG